MIPLFLLVSCLLLNLPIRHHCTPIEDCLVLHARKRNQRQQASESVSQTGVARPSRQGSSQHARDPPTKRINLSLHRRRNEPSPQDLTSDDFLSLSVYQVEDTRWWQDQENLLEQKRQDKDNPYGARCWPSSVAVAEYLIQDVLPSLETDAMILEIGCGPGIPSLAAALTQLSGHNIEGQKNCQLSVMATDVSPMALSLLRRGWTATLKRHEKQLAKKWQPDDINGSLIRKTIDNPLSIRAFDICSSEALPFPRIRPDAERRQPQLILVACTMLYEHVLAAALAKRISEAIRNFDAWVILGEDVTGERESGRSVFLAAMDNDSDLLVSNSSNIAVHIKNPALGWQSKETQIWEWNNPLSTTKISQR
jgi:SAM-dependent methyltransferase